MKKRFLFVIVAGLLAAAPGRAQELFMNAPNVLPAELESTYKKGLAYLVKMQDEDGGWPDPVWGKSRKQPAITGLVLLALMAHGDDPNFGPYATTIKRGFEYLLKQQDSRTGYIGPSMYNHGFATLALAEGYGAVNNDKLGPALEKAVALSLTSQAHNPEGAWRYSPESSDADTTVSGAIFVSLMAARNAGIAVPEEAIRKALGFYMKCASPRGGFGYSRADSPSRSRNAIGVLVFALARQKGGSFSQQNFGALARENAQETDNSSYPYYFEYYASQAYFQSDMKSWGEWNLQNLKHLVTAQTPDGSWEGPYGPSFSTAAGLLSLALNYRLLPIYER